MNRRHPDISMPGINIQFPWSELIISGKKKIETRSYQLPEKYIDKEMWLIETPGQSGKFKARIIGSVRFSGSKKYQSSIDFNADYGFHLVSKDDVEYQYFSSKPKFGWMIESVKKIESTFPAPFPRGIRFAKRIDGRNICFVE